MEPISLGLIGWWLWSRWYNKTHQPVVPLPLVASPLGVREGNYSLAVPAVGNKYSR